MIHAYDKIYLEASQKLLANAFQYAVYNMNIALSDFFDSFIQSDYSFFIENGDPSVC